MKPQQNSEKIRVEVRGFYHESFHADRWICKDCGIQIWSGRGRSYRAEDEKPDHTVKW